MDITKIKNIGKWLMIIGGGMFTCGAGVNLVCNHIEKNNIRKEHYKNTLLQEEEHSLKMKELETEALRAKTAKDDLYCKKLKDMDSKDFAKFHADSVAKANKDVMDRAYEIQKNAEAEIIKIKMECNDKINKINSDCLEKIEKATKLKDEAVKKYEEIDNLFTNKYEILEAKEKLERITRRDNESKKSKEEILKSIKDILD